MQQLFDSEKFRRVLQSTFGGRYIKKLKEITGNSEAGIRKWCLPEFAPKKGPAIKTMELIIAALKKEGVNMSIGDFYYSSQTADSGEMLNIDREIEEAKKENYRLGEEIKKLKEIISLKEERITELEYQLLQLKK